MNRTRLGTALLCLGTGLFFASIASATIYVVDPSGAGDFTRIQDAIESSHHGDIIEVRPGEYRESLFYGGRRIIVRGIEGPEVTILEGEESHNLATFLFGEPRESVLEGFTLRNGRGRPISSPDPHPSSEESLRRGGIPDASASADPIPPFRPVDLALHPLGPSDLRVSSLQQDQARGGTYGGAIVCLSASPTLRNLVFEDNLANVGGALAALYSAPLVEDCAFRGNVAGAGGAIAGRFDRLDIRNCRFSGNSTVFGGALHGEDSNANVESSTFNDNVAANGGSWYLLGTGNPARATVHHSQFGSNFASDASGISTRFHDLDVHHNVFWSMGEDLHVLTAVFVDGGEAAVNHCVFQGRNENSTFQCTGGAVVELGCNVFYPGLPPLGCSSDPTNIIGDPRFCDAANGDFHVSSGSPCLPEGSPEGCGAIGIHDAPGCLEPRSEESEEPPADSQTRDARDRAGYR